MNSSANSGTFFGDIPDFYEKIKVARRPYESFPLSSSSRSLLCVGKRTIKILHFIVDLPAIPNSEVACTP